MASEPEEINMSTEVCKDCNTMGIKIYAKGKCAKCYRKEKNKGIQIQL
jgi:hypothetical protein